MGLGRGKGYKNIMGRDPRVHSQSAKGMKQPQKIPNLHIYKGRELKWDEVKPIAKKTFDNQKLTKIEREKWDAWWKEDSDRDGVPDKIDCKPFDPTMQDTNIQVGDKFMRGELEGSSNNLEILNKGDKTFLIGYGHAVYGMRDKDTGKTTFFKGWDGYSRTTSKQLSQTGLRGADIVEDKKPSTTDLDKFYKVNTVVDISTLPTELTLAEMKKINQDLGMHFFDKDAVKFFNSKFETKGIRKGNNVYFITSEQFEPTIGEKEPRKYTIRDMDLNDGSIDTVGEFQQYDSKESAKKVLKEKVL